MNGPQRWLLKSSSLISPKSRGERAFQVDIALLAGLHTGGRLFRLSFRRINDYPDVPSQLGLKIRRRILVARLQIESPKPYLPSDNMLVALCECMQQSGQSFLIDSTKPIKNPCSTTPYHFRCLYLSQNVKEEGRPAAYWPVAVLTNIFLISCFGWSVVTRTLFQWFKHGWTTKACVVFIR